MNIKIEINTKPSKHNRAVVSELCEKLCLVCIFLFCLIIIDYIWKKSPKTFC